MLVNFVSWHYARLRGAARATAVIGATAIAMTPTSVFSASERIASFSGELNYVAFQQAAADNVALRITYSPGGSGAAAIALGRIRSVVIDGECNSACAWAFVRNSNACFTMRASFGFHAAHDPGTGARMNAATAYWMSMVRPGLREALHPLLSSSQVIRVKGEKMRTVYGDRICGAKEPKAEAAALQARHPAIEKVPPKKTIGLASLRDERIAVDETYPALLQVIVQFPPAEVVEQTRAHFQDLVLAAPIEVQKIKYMVMLPSDVPASDKVVGYPAARIARQRSEIRRLVLDQQPSAVAPHRDRRAECDRGRNGGVSCDEAALLACQTSSRAGFLR